jgi:uncharacterized membrane protein
MTNATLPANVGDYLRQLRAELADLAPDERDDLLAEVEASLLESAGDEPLDAQFGPPAAFAADLRASAGLPPRPAAPAPKARPRVNWHAVGRQAKTLAPIWWLARGYIAVAALALVAGATWSASYPAIPSAFQHGPRGGAVAIAIAVLASIALGMWATAAVASSRASRDGAVLRAALIAVDAVFLAAAIPVAAHLAHRAEPRPNPTVQAAQVALAAQAWKYQSALNGLSYFGTPVTNIYPYDRDGRLLHDIRLYGQDGHPLNIGKPGADPTRRTVETRRGVALNAYPIRYFDAGTGKVTKPDAGPRVLAPPITTKPLR